MYGLSPDEIGPLRASVWMRFPEVWACFGDIYVFPNPIPVFSHHVDTTTMRTKSTLNYRVLLSQGRDGFIIFIPPELKMASTYRAMKAAGVKEIRNEYEGGVEVVVLGV